MNTKQESKAENRESRGIMFTTNITRKMLTRTW